MKNTYNLDLCEYTPRQAPSQGTAGQVSIWWEGLDRGNL